MIHSRYLSQPGLIADHPIFAAMHAHEYSSGSLLGIRDATGNSPTSGIIVP